MNIPLSQVRIALAILAALALALLLNHYVVTDKKRVERTVQEMADAAAKGDLGSLFSHVSADYHDDAMSREQLRSLAKSVLERYEPANAEVELVSVNVTGSLAHAQVIISAGGQRDGYTPWRGTSEWSAEFRKEADGAWRLTSVTPTRIYGRQVSGWSDVLRRF
jgi:ketosteroid isomerase-like protein